MKTLVNRRYAEAALARIILHASLDRIIIHAKEATPTKECMANALDSIQRIARQAMKVTQEIEK